MSSTTVLNSRGWLAHLWHEWTVASWRAIPPAFAQPRPNEWAADRLTASWFGHSTVLINFFGVTSLTDRSSSLALAPGFLFSPSVRNA
ncbi:MAG: hypothetical protein ACR2G0_13275 [Chthoniobacterales bacterium]